MHSFYRDVMKEITQFAPCSPERAAEITDKFVLGGKNRELMTKALQGSVDAAVALAGIIFQEHHLTYSVDKYNTLANLIRHGRDTPSYSYANADAATAIVLVVVLGMGSFDPMVREKQ